MIRTAVTVSLVDEARGGPFVFWDDLEAAARTAAELGFDAIEIFAPSADAVDEEQLKSLLEELQLKVAGVGTGAGMVAHGLTLTDPDAGQRAKAADFVRSIIDFGASYNAPAVIGSMQGKWGGALDRQAALEVLRQALNELGSYAAEKRVPLIYEPLNRYETNLVNTVAEGVELMKSLEVDNVKLLADVFHMNIEEVDIPAAMHEGQGFIGHVHFVDSNRRAAGMGHLDIQSIADALKESGYDGYVSAEAFPIPDSRTAAKATIEAYRRIF